MNFDLTAEQIELRDHVAAFARDEVAPVAEQLDRECRFPTALYRKAGALGITAIPFDAEFGGMGLGTFEMTLAIEQLARADQSLAVTAMVSVAAGLILQRFGTAEQKARYLPAIVRGEAIGALAGTEPDAGSDTAGFKTHAARKSSGWVINGAEGVHHQRGHRHLDLRADARGHERRRRSAQGIHAVPCPERNARLRAGRAVPEDGLALERHAPAVFRRLRAGRRQRDGHGGRRAAPAAQGLPAGARVSRRVLARARRRGARSFGRVRAGAQGVRRSRSAACNSSRK